MSPESIITEVVTGGRRRLVRKSFKRTKPKQRTAPKKRAKGKLSLSKYKKELDRVFSIYIRTKYPKVCYTCGKSGALQNGHFIVRKYLATRWEEDNCRPQCIGCNIYGKGMSIDFDERLVQELGEARVAQMKASRKELWRLDEAWYVEKIAHYKALLETKEN